MYPPVIGHSQSEKVASGLYDRSDSRQSAFPSSVTYHAVPSAELTLVFTPFMKCLAGISTIVSSLKLVVVPLICWMNTDRQLLSSATLVASLPYGGNVTLPRSISFQAVLFTYTISLVFSLDVAAADPTP